MRLFLLLLLCFAPAPLYRGYRPESGQYLVLFEDETLEVYISRYGYSNSYRRHTGEQWYGSWKWENRKLKVYERDHKGERERGWEATVYTLSSFKATITTPAKRITTCSQP